MGLLQFLQERRRTYDGTPVGLGSHRQTCYKCQALLDRPFFDRTLRVHIWNSGAEFQYSRNVCFIIRSFLTPPALVNVLRRRLEPNAAEFSGDAILLADRNELFCVEKNTKWCKFVRQYRCLSEEEARVRRSSARRIR